MKEEMCDRPLVVIIDSEATFTTESDDSVLLWLLGSQQLPLERRLHTDIAAYELQLNTKYYSADVYLCKFTNEAVLQVDDTKVSVPSLGPSESFANSVEAVVVSGVSSARRWCSVVEEWPSVELKLLLVDSLSSADDDETKLWAVEHQFEIIELNPSDDTKAELADCREVFGFERLIEALRSHEWSNAVVNEDPTRGNTQRLMRLLHDEQQQERAAEQICDGEARALSKLLAGSGDTCHACTSATDGAVPSAIDGKTAKADMCTEGDEGSEQAVDEFDALLAKLSAMKQGAASMPESERKAYAEDVTLAFWRAIGGDEDEIDGIDFNQAAKR